MCLIDELLTQVVRVCDLQGWNNTEGSSLKRLPDEHAMSKVEKAPRNRSSDGRVKKVSSVGPDRKTDGLLKKKCKSNVYLSDILG